VAGETSAIESLHEDYDLLLELAIAGGPSALAALNRAFPKHLLLAAASNLEAQVKSSLRECFESHSGAPVASFVDRFVLARGYHALFDWPGGSAKGFFTSFGKSSGESFRAALGTDEDYRQGHDSFMYLGNARNQLVHNDYAVKTIDLTPSEVLCKYNEALYFVDRIGQMVMSEPVH
jgi:hypothetical protein